jgi:hypothetical protein
MFFGWIKRRAGAFLRAALAISTLVGRFTSFSTFNDKLAVVEMINIGLVLLII